MFVRGATLVLGTALLMASAGPVESHGRVYFRGLLEECEPHGYSAPVFLGHYYPPPIPPQVLRELEPLAPVYFNPPDGGASHWKPWKGTDVNLEADPVPDPPARTRGWEYDQRNPCCW